jgi:hypothetical protein
VSLVTSKLRSSRNALIIWSRFRGVSFESNGDFNDIADSSLGHHYYFQQLETDEY